MSLEVISAPQVDPGLVPLAFDHLKIEPPSDDLYEDGEGEAFLPLVSAYLNAAIARVEAMSGRMLFSRSLRWKTGGFPAVFRLPASPVSDVTAVRYVDPTGAEKTVPEADWVLIDRSENPSIYAAYGKDWPAVRAFPDSVTVEFTAGYGATMDKIPAALLQAVLMTVADWLRFGGNVATVAAHELPEDAFRACLSFRREWC